jgi:hypothetical protein
MVRETRRNRSAFFQKIEGMLPLLGGGDLEIRADHDFAEIITELRFADCSTDVHLQVREVELSTARDAS